MIKHLKLEENDKSLIVSCLDPFKIFYLYYYY